MPRRKPSNSEVSEPAVVEAAVNTPKSDDSDIVHDSHVINVDSLIDGVADTNSEADQNSNEKFVMYVGRATERNIDSSEWPAGVERNISASWGFHNTYKIPASAFTEKQLGYLLGDKNQEDGFKLVDGARS